MKIAIISDSHDNVPNLERIIQVINSTDIGAVIHCGDICAPFSFKELGKLKVPVHCVFGNSDGDKFELCRLSFTDVKNVTLHGELAQLEFDGVKIGVNHYPTIADGLAATGKYDSVFCGHTHVADIHTVGKCLVVNPGEVLGRKGKVTYAVFDTESKTAEIVSM